MFTKQREAPIIGESLACRKDDRKEAKEHDEYAVGTYLEADYKLVGHVPIELSFLIFTLLKARHENNVHVQVKVTGSRKIPLIIYNQEAWQVSRLWLAGLC